MVSTLAEAESLMEFRDVWNGKPETELNVGGLKLETTLQRLIGGRYSTESRCLPVKLCAWVNWANFVDRVE